MDEGIQVAYAMLGKKIGKKTQWWECELRRHEITGDYKLIRKWKTHGRVGKNKETMKPHETDWEIDGDRKFFWKIKQKLTFNNYNILKYTSQDDEFSLEILKDYLDKRV